MATSTRSQASALSPRRRVAASPIRVHLRSALNVSLVPSGRGYNYRLDLSETGRYLDIAIFYRRECLGDALQLELIRLALDRFPKLNYIESPVSFAPFVDIYRTPQIKFLASSSMPAVGIIFEFLQCRPLPPRLPLLVHGSCCSLSYPINLG